MKSRTDMALLLYPRFRDKASLVDELTRSLWYFEPIRENTKVLYVLYAGDDVSPKSNRHLLNEDDVINALKTSQISSKDFLLQR